MSHGVRVPWPGPSARCSASAAASSSSPCLNVGLGLPLKTASGISLMTVIATSNVVAAGSANRDVHQPAARDHAADCRRRRRPCSVPLVVQPLSVPDAVHHLRDASPRSSRLVMLTRLDRRNVILDASIDPGPLGGRYYEEESGREVVYQLRRLPAALGISLVGGILSGSARHRRRDPAGAGPERVVRHPDARRRRDHGGDDRRYGPRLRADLLTHAAASIAPLAAAAVLGVLIGSRAGHVVSARARGPMAEAADGRRPRAGLSSSISTGA